MKLSSINPATGELIESFEEISDADLEAALQRARQTFRTYRSTSFAERAAWLQKAAQILESESDTWARLMTREMGKTYKAALAEAQKCASGCRYFAENGARFLADEAIKTEADDSYVRHLTHPQRGVFSVSLSHRARAKVPTTPRQCHSKSGAENKIANLPCALRQQFSRICPPRQPSPAETRHRSAVCRRPIPLGARTGLQCAWNGLE